MVSYIADMLRCLSPVAATPKRKEKKKKENHSCKKEENEKKKKRKPFSSSVVFPPTPGKLNAGLIGAAVTFLLSIPILDGGIWLAMRGSTDHKKFLQGPVIVVDMFLMLASLMGGSGGALCHQTRALVVSRVEIE